MSQNSTKKFGFTLIELLVVISIIALLLGILVPVLGIAKKNAAMMKESVNLRNIHVALTTYGTANKDWFPGLLSSGKFQNNTNDFTGKYYAAVSNTGSAGSAASSVGLTSSYAAALTLEDASTNPAQWYSPGETNTGGAATALTAMQEGAPATDGTASTTTVNTDGYITSSNNSFALLAYGSSTLKPEWKSNQNQQAAILGTRIMGGGTQGTLDNKFNTVWTDSTSGVFKGAIVRGDSSTTSENFKAADVGTSFGVLRYGAVASSINTAVQNKTVGIYASAVVTSNGIDATSGDTYGTGAGEFGAGSPSGTFVTGMIGSAND